MSRSFLALALVATLGGLMAAHLSVPLPESRIVRASTAPKPAPPAPHILSPTTVAAGPATAPEARQAPVPLVRAARAAYEPPKPKEAPAVDAEAQAQAELDKKAAKAAIEADGYKRVTVLAKQGDGQWRAKAFRGATEVRLTVDASGRVSAD